VKRERNLVGLLFTTSCGARSNGPPNDDSTGLQTNEVFKKQEAIAKENLSIEHASK
jgi:hypothetical protein